MGVTKTYAAKQFLNAALVAAVTCIASGAWGHYVDQSSRQVVIEFDPDTEIAGLDVSQEDRRQIECLARNVYFEARNQPEEGQQAIVDVVLNRIEQHPKQYPDLACQVITECDPATGVCQFSWFHDGLDHKIHDREAFKTALRISYNSWVHRDKVADVTDGATHYHADYVDPKRGVWGRVKFIKKIGAHLFYKG